MTKTATRTTSRAGTSTATPTIRRPTTPSTGMPTESRGRLSGPPTTTSRTWASAPAAAGVAALVSSAGRDAAGAHQISEPLDANEIFQVTRATASPIESTPCATCFPGLAGAEWNIQYGYGRPNVYRAMKAVHEGNIPPTADITAPEWYDEVDPTQQATVALKADVAARRSPSYEWKLQYAAGVEPADNEFKTVAFD